VRQRASTLNLTSLLVLPHSQAFLKAACTQRAHQCLFYSVSRTLQVLNEATEVRSCTAGDPIETVVAEDNMSTSSTEDGDEDPSGAAVQCSDGDAILDIVAMEAHDKQLMLRAWDRQARHLEVNESSKGLVMVPDDVIGKDDAMSIASSEGDTERLVAEVAFLLSQR
jgi:hypothetical protein